MNLLGAWKKVLLFGLFGAAGCLAGWAVGEGYLATARAATDDPGAAATLITKPAPPGDAPGPSGEFKDRLDREKAKTGDVQLSLIWYNKNDLDLHCIDPKGVEIYFDNPRSPTNGELDVDANAHADRRGGVPLTNEPVENIYWPAGGAPPGKYVVFINHYHFRPETGAPNETRYKVSVLHSGRREQFEGKISNNGSNKNPRTIVEFELRPRVEVFAPAEVQLPRAATLKVPVAVRRAYYNGPLAVRAENLPDGVTAESVTIPEGKTEGELTLKAGESAAEIKKGIKVVATGGDQTGSADVQLDVPKPVARFSPLAVVLIGVWTALLAVGLCLALLAGQNRYLRRPLFGGGTGLLVGVILGAIAAGFVSGSVGQALYSVLLAVGVGSLGFVVGWVLLGGLLGLGVSLFVPNLDRKKAGLAGLAGGLLGAVAYLAASNAGDWLGRLAGAAALGFCIGLVVAIVEAAFRRAWLEVRFGGRETITVNLGPEPVKVGGDAKLCTVWARGAPEVALRYFVRDGQVVCDDVPARRETVVANGDVRTAGTVTLTVHTASGGRVSASPPVGGENRGLTPPARQEAPLSLDPEPLPEPVEVNRGLTPPARPEPAVPNPVPDFDDGLPMPIGPPPPPRPKVASILDDEFLPPVRPAAPPKPPVPVTAPKPTAAAKPPAAAGTDACPTCGRKSPGRPGERYCVLCDKTY